MTSFHDYSPTAGFPPAHIEAFKRVSCANRMVISSRGLNPLCTDLLLEGYAAKGYHIKAKTCDWGPMAGFVPKDYRFTKASQRLDQQKAAVQAALAAGARTVPLVISTTRLTRLLQLGACQVASRDARMMVVKARPGPDAGAYEFALIKQRDATHWAICYHARGGAAVTGRRYGEIETRGLQAVEGLANPAQTSVDAFKSAVCGDYDLWCVLPHATLQSPGVDDRLVPVRAALIGKPARDPASMVASRARNAGIVSDPPSNAADLARWLGDQHLGNLSLTINRIRRELNRACGAPGGDVVMHADYGGYPLGTIDYPIIFFIPLPDTGFRIAEAEVATSLATLKPLLKRIGSLGYKLALNPTWALLPFDMPAGRKSPTPPANAYAPLAGG